MANMTAAQVRQRQGHPVIDGDGHWLEVQSVFLEYLADVAGPHLVDRYRSSLSRSPWYGMDVDERYAKRQRRPGWWPFAAGTMSRAAANLPSVFYDHLDDWGIDVALVYPSFGLRVSTAADEEIRRALTRAYNIMLADLFGRYSDRLIPAAVVPLNTPDEAIDAISHACSLGLKLMMMNGAVHRPIDADAASQPDLQKRRTYIDCVGIDSPYDYNPVWSKCVEAGVAVTNHEGSFAWPDRCSPSSHVMNHLGHFAQGNHYFARGLFMGGVTQRHPRLNFGFLEGGVSWACQLQSDLTGHWEKRNRDFMHKYLKPTNVHVETLIGLFRKESERNPRIAAVMNRISAGKFDNQEPDATLEDLARRDEAMDDFAKLNIKSAEDVLRLFANNFYFGCEADDPLTALAFDPKYGSPLKPFLGSDISHWDVPDPAEVMVEAWEMVEHKLLTEEQFREFTFSNVVGLHGGMNANFFAGTVVEAAATSELAQAKAA